MADDYDHLEHDPVYAGKYTDARIKNRGNALYSNYISSRMIGRIPGSLRHRALDLMCGSGVMFQAIDNGFDDFIGVDSSPAMLKLVPERFTEHTILADATALPGDIGKFDVAFIRGGLHHEPDGISQVIAEVKRVLLPSGRIIVWEPCADFLPVRKLRDRVYKKSDFFDSDHERGLYAEEISIALEKAGFADIKIRHTGNLAYLTLFNSDISPIARLIGSMPFSTTFGKVIIAFEKIWENIPWLNKAAFNVLIEASNPETK